MAQSSSLPGNKLKAWNEDEHLHTEHSGETALLESLSADTQLVDLNRDTEVLDIPDFADNLRSQMVDDSEEEVALDSDDEAIQRNGVLTAIKVMSCDGPNRTVKHKSGFLMRRVSICAASESVDANRLGRSSLTDIGSYHEGGSNHVNPQFEEVTSINIGVSGIHQKTIGTNVDAVNLDNSCTVPEPARLGHIESQEPEESSQAALDFVDRFLSVNDVNLPQEVEMGNPNKLISPPALSVKGFRNLARGANLRNNAWDPRTFDWDDNQPELILGWRSRRERSLKTPQLANKQKFPEKVVEKGKDTNSKLVDSRLKVHKSNQISEVRKTTETAGEMGSSEELDKQIDAEPLDVLDMDVGFDTQMAAEAMEALLYAPPPIHDANVDQGLKDMLEKTSKCESVKRVTIGCSFPESGSFGSEVTARFYERRTRGSDKLSRNKSTSIPNDSKNKLELNLSADELKVGRGKLPEKCLRVINSKRRASKTSSTMITRKEEEFIEKENIRYVRNTESSNFVDSNLLCQIEEKVRSSSPVACRTGSRSSVESSITAKDVDCDYGQKGRDGDKLWGGRRKRSKLRFNSSVEATICEANPDKATSKSNWKSTPWIFPKRKRTSQYESYLLELPSTFTLSNVLDDVNCNRSDEEYQIKSGEPRTPCLSSIVTRKVRSAQSLCHSSDKTCVDNTIAGKFSEECFESVAITGQMAHENSARAKVSWKSNKQAKMDPTSSAGSKESKESELSNVSVQASTTMPTSWKDYKQQYKRNSSSSPLLRELTRLGFAESLPDFVSADMRRRNRSNIRVLFSQSLDDRMIKRQKKILVRLGLCVASDCSDATHFVADRFVRTRNMLEVMALGKPVVTHLWLENCLEAKYCVDEKKYMLQDFKREKELGFNMLVSLTCAKEHPLLKDQQVIVTPNVKPSTEIIESLVKKVHGKVLEGSQKTARKDKVRSTDLLILSCEEDYAACVPFLEEGAAAYSSELLLNGIVIQKLEYERHRIFKDHVDTDSHAIHQKKQRNQHVPATTSVQ